MPRLSSLKFLARNGPLAIASSAFPGFVNYFIIVFLTYGATPSDVGVYRLLISFFAMIGLVSIQESSKVFVRLTASNETDAYATIFLVRLTFCVLSALIVAIALAVGVLPYSDSLAIILFISLFFYPTDLFNSYFQARGRFNTMAALSLTKYGASLLIFLLSFTLGASTVLSTYLQLACITIANILFFLLFIGKYVLHALRTSLSYLKRLSSKPAKESMILSLANILPGSLEHLDKFVIGYSFGLEALGIYTLGFSTGRFVYNALKPAIYIYYARFVDRMPSGRLLWFIMFSFTAFGLMLAAAFAISVTSFDFMSRFAGTMAVTCILFASYGIAMVDAVYLQAYAINRETNSNHLLIANTIAGTLCLLLFGVASLTTAYAAMIICSVHYPFRHAVTVLIVSWLRRRSQA